ncbi:MAG: hypothetical protein AAFY57_20415, partial [Cyanobacteria bacterium J06642_2]
MSSVAVVSCYTYFDSKAEIQSCCQKMEPVDISITSLFDLLGYFGQVASDLNWFKLTAYLATFFFLTLLHIQKRILSKEAKEEI